MNKVARKSTVSKTLRTGGKKSVRRVSGGKKVLEE